MTDKIGGRSNWSFRQQQVYDRYGVNAGTVKVERVATHAAMTTGFWLMIYLGLLLGCGNLCAGLPVQERKMVDSTREEYCDVDYQVPRTGTSR